MTGWQAPRAFASSLCGPDQASHCGAAGLSNLAGLYKQSLVSPSVGTDGQTVYGQLFRAAGIFGSVLIPPGSCGEDHLALAGSFGDHGGNQQIPAQFGIRSIPTLMLFKDGKLASQKVGAAPKSDLSRWISAAV